MYLQSHDAGRAYEAAKKSGRATGPGAGACIAVGVTAGSAARCKDGCVGKCRARFIDDLFRRIMRCFELKAYRVRRISKMKSRHACVVAADQAGKATGEQPCCNWSRQQISASASINTPSS